jgi:hypothetical protein
MLMIGAVWKGFDPHDNRTTGARCLTPDEERTQMAIYAIVSAPLIMAADVRSIPEDSKAILLNKRAIAVSQDLAGHMGVRLSPTASAEQVWAKTLTASAGATGKAAVALYNRGSSSSSSSSSGGSGGSGGAAATISFRFADIPDFLGDSDAARPVTVTDIFRGNTSTVTSVGGFTAFGVPDHGTVFLTIEA